MMDARALAAGGRGARRIVDLIRKEKVIFRTTRYATYGTRATHGVRTRARKEYASRA